MSKAVCKANKAKIELNTKNNNSNTRLVKHEKRETKWRSSSWGTSRCCLVALKKGGQPLRFTGPCWKVLSTVHFSAPQVPWLLSWFLLASLLLCTALARFSPGFLVWSLKHRGCNALLNEVKKRNNLCWKAAASWHFCLRETTTTTCVFYREQRLPLEEGKASRNTITSSGNTSSHY